MAITNAGISYAQGFTMTGAEQDLTGMIQYRNALYGDLMYDFTDTTRVNLRTMSDGDIPSHTIYNQANRKVLTTYVNGDTLYYTEWWEQPSNNYIIAVELVNKDSQVLYRDDLSLGTRTRAEIVDKRLVWVPTFTNYPQRPPVTGDYPDGIYPYGTILVAKKPDEELQYFPDGIIGRDDLRRDWYDNTTDRTISSDQEYTNWVNGEGGGNVPKKPEDDPSGTGGGGGSYRPDITGDVIPVPGLPTVGAVSTGMINLYNPTLEQIRNLANFLWSGSFLDNIGKLKNDPFENIISLSMIPYQPANQGSEICVVGNISTGVTMRLCSQYQKVSCGSLKITEQWGGFLDYSPYTHIDLYLPFIGIVKLMTDDVMGKTLSVDYNIDVLTGSSICHVSADGKVLYTYNCNTTYHIPLTLSNANQQMTALASIGSHTIMGALTGAGVGSMAGGVGAVPGAVIGGITGGLSAVANGITAKQHSVQRSGSITGEGGLLGDFKPYVIIHRPVQSLPNNFKHFKGYASNISGTLGSFSGYTEVAYAHLDGVSATDTEKDEIMQLLSKGVIV